MGGLIGTIQWRTKAMFKRILTLALAVSVVTPVVAKNSNPTPAPAAGETSLVRRALLPVGALATLASAVAADKHYNDGRASKALVSQLAKGLTQVRGSKAYTASTAKVSALLAYIAQTHGVKAAGHYAAALRSRMPTVTLPSIDSKKITSWLPSWR